MYIYIYIYIYMYEVYACMCDSTSISHYENKKYKISSVTQMIIFLSII